MATFKATVRGVRTDGFMQVYIRVSHHKRHGYIKTDKMVTRKELNKQGEIKDPFVLNYCTERIMAFNDRLNKKDISKWSVAEVGGVPEEWRMRIFVSATMRVPTLTA